MDITYVCDLPRDCQHCGLLLVFESDKCKTAQVCGKVFTESRLLPSWCLYFQNWHTWPPRCVSSLFPLLTALTSLFIFKTVILLSKFHDPPLHPRPPSQATWIPDRKNNCILPPQALTQRTAGRVGIGFVCLCGTEEGGIGL